MATVQESPTLNDQDSSVNQTVGTPYETNSFHSDKVELAWESPRLLAKEEAFQISYKDDIGKWKTVDKTTQDGILTIKGLKSQTTYYFRVRIINDTTGEEGKYSMSSKAIQTGESPALKIKQDSCMHQEGTPPVYKLPIKEDKTVRNRSAKTRKFVLGEPNETLGTEEKTIMFVGATGSGKSTLINAIANYVLGITWEDCFRFMLVDLEPSEAENQGDQSHSQTEWVTCYTIYKSVSSRIEYTINLIDTPGFGDTRGLEQDAIIVSQIRELFTTKGCKAVDTLDALCFLVKAPDSRMTIAQKYIFDSILSLFGLDIKDNICTLITFADGQRPPVLDAVKAIDGVPLPYEEYFTFNNSALFAQNDKIPVGSLSPMFWDMGIQSCKKFFLHVTTLETKSLTLTAEVLQSRHILQNKIHNLQVQIDEGMSKIITLEEEIDIFTKWKHKIKDNADFTYYVSEIRLVKESLEGTGKHTTTCLVCNFTCHKVCKISDDKQKAKCIAMKDGKCIECPNLCEWNQHYNTTYYFKTVMVQSERRYDEKLKRYEEATKQKLSQEQVVANMRQDITALDDEIQILVRAINALNNRLRDIALRPDPMSAENYIDLVIESEMKDKRKGFKSRIEALRRCKALTRVGQNVEQYEQRKNTVISDEQINDAVGVKQSIWTFLRKITGRAK